MDRPAITTREGLHGDIVTTTTFDAAGRRLTNTIEAGDLSQSTENKYDSAGRLAYSIDATGLRTDYAYEASGLVTSITHPGGTSETTTNYADGRVKSITGSSVIPQYYEYGVNPDGSQWTTVRFGSPTSPRWQKTTTDMLGRTIMTEQPGFTGTITSQNVYNDLGQLVRTESTGRAATIFEYDLLGNQYRSGIDIDGNQALDLDAIDRITETDTKYTLIGSDWWQETNQYVYANANDSSPTKVSTQRSRMSGFTDGLVSESSQQDINGNETVSSTVLDPAMKRSTTSTNFPDAIQNQTSISEYGVLVSNTSKSGLTVAYDYDALNRRTGTSDPRTGRSTIHYDANGRVDYVEDAAGNRTGYGYDPDTGRKVWEKNALGKYTLYRYNDQGQVTHIWGDTTYPLRYEYNAYGQRSHMYTYQGGSDWNSTTWPTATGTANATVWHYDEATGLLTSKEDAAGKEVSYLYTATNQLQTRTWARMESGNPLFTTYAYDPNTAELKSIDYSDTTTDISFSYDRLGRQKTVTDAVGARTFGYTDALQLGSETITGLYNEKDRGQVFILDK